MAIGLSEFIQEKQKQLELEDQQVAELADIDLDVYLRYKHGEVQKLHTMTLTKIAAALKVELSELLRIAGVRRRRTKATALQIRSTRSIYNVNSSSIEATNPIYYSELMRLKAEELETEALQQEQSAHLMMDRARSLREQAQVLRRKADRLLKED